jgi:hypothetical protein
MWRTDYCQIRFIFIHSDFYLPVSVSIHDENRSTAIPKDLNVLYWKYISHWISVSIKLKKSKHIRCQEKYTIVSWSRLSYEKCRYIRDTCSYLFEFKIEDSCWVPPLLESKFWKCWWVQDSSRWVARISVCITAQNIELL